MANKIYLKDYTKSAYLIDTVDLVFDICPEGNKYTIVTAKMLIKKHPEYLNDQVPLILHGEKLELINLILNQQVLTDSTYIINENSLTLNALPDGALLEITTRIYPEQNKELYGLYYSGSMYCTQCEPEGFRRIMYYIDRPDVLAKFTTTIIADKKTAPVLLSNGNLDSSGVLNHNRHWAKWVDPFRKPCYLFALVAGDLMAIEDHYLTEENKLITLKIFVEPENINKTMHALTALKKAMSWDEKEYGRCYDLNYYMIVAVNDFNMGAMENKGLNIFNSKYVLANAETATDQDYLNIDTVIAHEYFHNWSGNRVTLRDWFQLSLKEGFTVFRDQSFTEDVANYALARLDSIELIRTRQFAEDSGAMSHPVQPDSYAEINNFYTLTVYDKGAEVVRMLKTLLGPVIFRKGTDLYFTRYDGCAATVDDFLNTMSEVSGRNLGQFKYWYTLAGTPEVIVEENYIEKNKTYELTLKQNITEDKIKFPLHIPIKLKLFFEDGTSLGEQVIELVDRKKKIVFENIATKPILSILRDFSAPIIIKHTQDHKLLCKRLLLEDDVFCKVDIAQKFLQQEIERIIQLLEKSSDVAINPELLNIFNKLLAAPMDYAVKAKIIKIPSIHTLLQNGVSKFPHIILTARKIFAHQFALKLKDTLLQQYKELKTEKPYVYNNTQFGIRLLQHTYLWYLLNLQTENIFQIAEEQYKLADNMTDKYAILANILNYDTPESKRIANSFKEQYLNNALVINKWLTAQALSEKNDVLNIIKNLKLDREVFNIENPNKVYALFGSFFNNNLGKVHSIDGAAYKFLTATVLEIDSFNPHIAARLLVPFTQSKALAEPLQKLIYQELNVLNNASLSRDVREIVERSLVK